MQHALRYVWSIPSARAEQKRIILSLNIPIRNIMTDRAVFRKNVFRYFHGFVKIFSCAIFSSTNRRFSLGAVRGMVHLPHEKPRVLCKSAKGGERFIMYDIIIRNGRVIDPQNKFDAKADVAIYNGKIVGVGDYQNAESDRVLDAAGHIVTPGLIDAHAHLWPLTKMGISTECTCIPSAVTTAIDAGQRRLGDLRDEPRLHQHLQGTCKNAGQRQPYGPAVQRIP